MDDSFDFEEDGNSQGIDVPILDWLAYFFSSLDVKNFTVSKRKGASTASSKISPTLHKACLSQEFIKSLQKEHLQFETSKKHRSEEIKQKVIQHHLKPEEVPITSNDQAGDGKLLVTFPSAERENLNVVNTDKTFHSSAKDNNADIDDGVNRFKVNLTTTNKAELEHKQDNNNEKEQDNSADPFDDVSEVKVNVTTTDDKELEHKQDNNNTNSVNFEGQVFQGAQFYMLKDASSQQLDKTRAIFKQEKYIQDFKSPKYTATCKWDLEMFSKHVKRLHFMVLEFLIDKYEVMVLDDDLKANLCKKMIDDSVIYPDVCTFGTGNEELKLIDLAKNDANETVVRTFLNHILTTVSLSAGLTLHPEQNLKGKEFTCPRADYVLKKNGIAIGSVEVKSALNINRNVIVQLLLQLLKIQSFNNSADLCYCGLLTDGFRYIFVLLKGSQFIFESEIDSKRQTVITSSNEVVNVKEKVRIFYAKTWSDLYEITSRFITLLDECLATFRKCVRATQPTLQCSWNKLNKVKQSDHDKTANKHRVDESDTGNKNEEYEERKKSKVDDFTYSIDNDGIISID